MLEIKDVHSYYGNIHALKGINLAVTEGEIVTLIGGNGAGKTTTLRTICGLMRPRTGSLVFEGKDLTAWEPHELVSQGIAMVPEGRGVFAKLTVEENLEMGAFHRNDKEGIAEDIEKSYELFPRLGERRSQLAGTMSGGEQQMLAVTRALMSKPRLLLMDEPSMGLAPVLVDVIFDAIEEINSQGMTILLVEQNAHLALQVANRGYVLQTGEIVLSDDAKVLQKDPTVQKAYLGMDH
ncbi:MAG: branched-chain amino acid transport system ATP-binding protein [Cellvibrionaceae bacterium]|jgi:branched-chain amino acid transport system ATP-binding protein